MNHQSESQPNSRLWRALWSIGKPRTASSFYFLYRRGNYWNFPKGHFKPGERSIDAALRELEEETGIKKSELRIAPNFRAYERFYFRIGNEGIYDTVILFLSRNP
jgi:8-oxo-dGTP pyrophosphatase MutT (NUDIX family)